MRPKVDSQCLETVIYIHFRPQETLNNSNPWLNLIIVHELAHFEPKSIHLGFTKNFTKKSKFLKPFDFFLTVSPIPKTAKYIKEIREEKHKNPKPALNKKRQSSLEYQSILVSDAGDDHDDDGDCVVNGM